MEELPIRSDEKEKFQAYFSPYHTPVEKSIANRISGLFKGSRVLVKPLSVRYGDDITAVGMACTQFTGSATELHEPFKAYLEEFDGQYLKLRTEHHYCLRVDIADLRDLLPCASEIDG